MILIKDLYHIYNSYSGRDCVGVKNINLQIADEEIIALIGVSGAGKSTLLHCINRLIEPTTGKIFIDGEDILSYSEKHAQIIRRKIGIIFQNYNLLRRSLVINNVLLGRLGFLPSIRSFMGINGYSKEDIQFAKSCLRKVGIEDLSYRQISDISGGQRQRVSIARTLCQQPSIILADEPVSSLDPTRGKEIMNLLIEIHKREKITMIVSLHDINIAKKYANRIIGLTKGEVIFDGKPEELSEEIILEIFG